MYHSLKMDQSRFGIAVLYALFWTCYLSGIAAAQQQSFRVRPTDVEAKLGDYAIIRCEVDNQAGMAQWTRSGFALGFDRDLHNVPRLSYVGDSDRGVHNLRIENVTLSDITEYQCQVGPGKGNKAIRADAHLNVLVPPKSMEITNHGPDATITLKEKEQTELECVVREARPAASVIWYRNDVVLRTETREDTTELVDVVVSGTTIQKNTTRSKIKFLPSSEDDKARYVCEARHPALVRPQQISVHLSVQYPPGAPRIDGYNEGEIIRENQSVSLTCISRGGNPSPELIWYKNDVRIDSTYATSYRESRNELTFMANTRDNLANFRCEATNLMSSIPKVADVVLTVQFPPREVKITGVNEGKIGDMITLNCASTNSNPKADIAWFKGGVSLDNPFTTSSVSPDGGWTTQSNVTFKVEPGEGSFVVTCQAINKGLGESKVASHTINVIRAPGHPVIYKTSLNFSEGHLHKIICTSVGGHPVPNLQWYREDKKIESTNEKEGNTAKAELSLVANASDNGVTYRCEAKNKALQTAYSESVTFHVLFPPRTVSINVKPKKLKEGERAYLTCESSSSNPPAKVVWQRNGIHIPAHTNSTKDGVYGGKKTVTTLELNLTSELDNVAYTCQATNSAIKKSVHDGVTLQVLYKPKFIDSPGEKVSVVEGEAAVVMVKAKANPDQIKYKWSRNNTPLKIKPKKLFFDGPVLNWTSVGRKDKGKYECEASNSEGSTLYTVELDVQYKPTVEPSSEYVMVGEGESAHLDCTSDANPLDESMVKWTHEREGKMSELESRISRSFQDTKSYLTIYQVTLNDSGLYTCTVNNKIGEPANASIYLIVKRPPDIDLSPQIAKAASNKGETGKLICRARGNPNVTFSWSREGALIATNDSKYSIQYSRIDMMTWESVLSVKNVLPPDYGLYECMAHNSLGDETHQVRLEVRSVPEPPNGLKVVNFTQDSVTLSWSPGFDGGHDQSFKVKWWKVGGFGGVRTDEVFPKNATVYTINGLSPVTEFGFSVAGKNLLGEGNYTTDIVRQETSIGPNPYATPEGEFPSNPFSRLVISVFIIVGATMLFINIFLIACFLKRRSKKRLSSASEQGSSKSAIEMYGPPSSYNETVNGETLSSISEKSGTYSHPENHDDDHHYIEDGGKGPGASTYLVEQINHHHSSGFPYRDIGGVSYSTLPRKIHHGAPIEPVSGHPVHHEDDGYVDALRRNAYNNQGVGDKTLLYGRTTPRVASRPPNVPPIPELYNIPPEARYIPFPPPGFGGSPVGNGSVRHSSSHNMLNSAISPTNTSSFQANGRLITANGPLSPGRGSILTTFAPNPSPMMEHEGHLV
ncbi:nephrin isoform X2 [Folsomia candida]|uniref:nephrin isoform X2 n=1 Tax=Folsomia candida TaxID=158441 RepID=UPI001604D29B|nr:nephrin isoform X2 [Folsomia candida]